MGNTDVLRTRVAAYLGEVKKRARLSDAELARQARVSPRTFRQLLVARETARPHTLERLFRAFGHPDDAEELLALAKAHRAAAPPWSRRRPPPLPTFERITVETFRDWVNGLPAREGLTLKEIGRRSDVGPEPLRRMRAGLEVRVRSITALFRAFGAPDGAEDVIQHAAERERARGQRAGRAARRSSHGPEKAPTATPVAAPLKAARARFGSWKGLRHALAAASCPVALMSLYRWRDGLSIPPRPVVSAVAALLAFSPSVTAKLIEACERERQARQQMARSTQKPQTTFAPKVACSGDCGTVRYVCEVKGQKTFDAGPPPTWTCRWCSKERAQVEIRCVKRGCRTKPRHQWVSASWKLEHEDDLQPEGWYAGACQRHNAKEQGGAKANRDRMRDILCVEFVLWYQASGHAGEPDPDPQGDVDPQEYKKFTEWYQLYAPQYRNRFATKRSRDEAWRFAGELSRDQIWPIWKKWARARDPDIAPNVDPEERRRCEAITAEFFRERVRELRARRRPGQRRPRTFKARAARIERNTGARLFGTRRVLGTGHALALCVWCYTLVGAAQVSARRYLHDGLCDQLQGPIIVPWWAPRPPTADGPARHYRWLVQLANGKTWTEIADRANVSTPTVLQGVEYLIRLFPGDLALAVPHAVTRKLVSRVVGERRKMDDLERHRLDINRIHHLGRAGMAPANIGCIVVGFTTGQIAALLASATPHRPDAA